MCRRRRAVRRSRRSQRWIVGGRRRQQRAHTICGGSRKREAGAWRPARAGNRPHVRRELAFRRPETIGRRARCLSERSRRGKKPSTLKIMAKSRVQVRLGLFFFFPSPPRLSSSLSASCLAGVEGGPGWQFPHFRARFAVDFLPAWVCRAGGSFKKKKPDNEEVFVEYFFFNFMFFRMFFLSFFPFFPPPPRVQVGSTEWRTARKPALLSRKEITIGEVTS